MVGKKSGKALLREEGLQRTDNNLGLTMWPQVTMINQKNYYTDYLKRDDQVLALRLQAEDLREKMAKEARDRDRALALENGEQLDADMEDEEAAEEEDEALQESRMVVIHPGSQNLRIGLASDALPKTVPMCIARKWKAAVNDDDELEPLPKRIRLEEDGSEPAPEEWFGPEFAKEYQAMQAELKVHMRANKRRVLPNSKELVINFNRREEYESISEHNDPHRVEFTELPTDPRQAPDYITGNAALRIPEKSTPRYKLFWPLQNGWFNEKDYPTRTLLLQDFADIIDDAIREQCGLPKDASWNQYSCVFIVPDLYDRKYVTNALELVLKGYGFGRVCFIQESLAASFGAGYSQACVVDIGAQKTSICCVEDGMCVEDSRTNLKFGGWDVTETFIKMMLFDSFPYAELNLRIRHDFLLAEELKQKYCTMNEGEISVQLFNFHLRAFGQETRKYEFKTYDEPILAPMGYFRPTIFDPEGKLQGRRQLIDRAYDLYEGDPSDPMSAAQLAVIQAAGGHLLTPATNGAGPASNTEAATNGNTPQPAGPKATPLAALRNIQEYEGTPKSSEAGTPAPEREGSPGAAGPDTKIADAKTEAQHNAEQRDRVLPISPLDTAIVQSIRLGARGDEKKVKEYLAGIMLIGGGGKIPGLTFMLEERLRALQAAYAKDILVGTPPRELDPQVLVWKGGSVFGKLSGTNDSWIGHLEYDRLGSRVLAYKAIWSW